MISSIRWRQDATRTCKGRPMQTTMAHSTEVPNGSSWNVQLPPEVVLPKPPVPPTLFWRYSHSLKTPIMAFLWFLVGCVALFDVGVLTIHYAAPNILGRSPAVVATHPAQSHHAPHGKKHRKAQVTPQDGPVDTTHARPAKVPQGTPSPASSPIAAMPAASPSVTATASASSSANASPSASASASATTTPTATTSSSPSSPPSESSTPVAPSPSMTQDAASTPPSPSSSSTNP